MNKFDDLPVRKEYIAWDLQNISSSTKLVLILIRHFLSGCFSDPSLADNYRQLMVVSCNTRALVSHDIRLSAVFIRLNGRDSTFHELKNDAFELQIRDMNRKLYLENGYTWDFLRIAYECEPDKNKSSNWRRRVNSMQSPQHGDILVNTRAKCQKCD